MKLTRNELIVVGVIIVYVAFFTHPAPSHITNFLESPIGHIVALMGVGYVIVYQSFIVGLFLGIAYIMTARNVTEYLNENEQTPKEEEKKEESKTVTASGIPPPAVTGAMNNLITKGDTRIPQTEGKSKTTKPAETQEPKASSSSQLDTKKVESFSNF
jgi:hypothetical protein